MHPDTFVYMKTKRRLTRRESQEATRARLLQSAARIFVRAGFDGASVEQIAEEAGYSRGAFYSNFADKDEIFLEVLSRRRVAMARELEEIFRRNPDPTARLQAVRDWYVEQWRQKEWMTLRLEFLLRALRSRTARTRLAQLLRDELGGYAGLVAMHFASARTPVPERPETIALSLLAVAQGLGSIALVDPEWAAGVGFHEAPGLVFNRLVGGTKQERRHE